MWCCFFFFFSHFCVSVCQEESRRGKNTYSEQSASAENPLRASCQKFRLGDFCKVWFCPLVNGGCLCRPGCSGLVLVLLLQLAMGTTQPLAHPLAPHRGMKRWEGRGLGAQPGLAPAVRRLCRARLLSTCRVLAGCRGCRSSARPCPRTCAQPRGTSARSHRAHWASQRAFQHCPSGKWHGHQLSTPAGLGASVGRGTDRHPGISSCVFWQPTWKEKEKTRYYSS